MCVCIYIDVNIVQIWAPKILKNGPLSALAPQKFLAGCATDSVKSVHLYFMVFMIMKVLQVVLLDNTNHCLSEP